MADEDNKQTARDYISLAEAFLRNLPPTEADLRAAVGQLLNAVKALATATLLLFVLSAPAKATTTVAGHIADLGTNAVTSGTFVRFYLRGCSGGQPRVLGTALIAPTRGAVWFKDFIADVNGNISGTIYSTRDATGNGNGDIDCNGSRTAVYYGMQTYVSGQGGPEIPIHAKSGATLDVTAVVPITSNPVVIPPTGDTSYLRLDGGNSPLSGAVSSSSTISDAGGAHTGTETFSGATSVDNLNGAITVDGGTAYPKTQTGLTNAITAATSAGTCVLIPPNTNISISSSVSWNSSNACFYGSGPTSVITCTGSTSFTCLSFVGTLAITSSNLASNSNEGSNTVALTAGGVSSLGLGVGSYIYIIDSNASPSPDIQVTRVTNIAGDTLTTADPMFESFTTANTAKVQLITPLDGVRIGNFKIDLTGQTGSDTRGLQLLYAVNSEVSDITVVGAQSTGFGVNVGPLYKSRVRNIRLISVAATAGYSDFQIAQSTGVVVDGVFSQQSGGFGPEFVNVNGSNISNIISAYAGYRGQKFFHSSWNNETGVQVHDASSIGTSYSGMLFDSGSRRNNISGCAAQHNGTTGGAGGGIDFEGSSNNNTVSNCVALNNTFNTGNDLASGTSGGATNGNLFSNVTFATSSLTGGNNIISSKYYQHVRVASCTTAAGANSTCNTTVNWSNSWADSNYSPFCSLDAASVVGGYLTQTASKANASIVAQISNGPVGGAMSGTIDCFGIHDP